MQAQHKACIDLHNCHLNTFIFPTLHPYIEGKRDYKPACVSFVSNCTEQVSSATGS